MMQPEETAPPEPSAPADGLDAASGPPARPPWWRTGRSRPAALAASAVLAVLGVAWAGTGYTYAPYAAQVVQVGADDEVARAGAAAGEAAPPVAAAPTASDVVRLKTRQRQLRARLGRLAPRGLYIVIDQTNNRLYLRKDDQVLLDATCSAGSGMVLKEGEGGRQWVFDTPRGRFQVLTRIENPIWKKPDWAFVEEGEPIPKNAGERFEAGTLGEYAFYFGNGYMIHGTLYERLLGRSVTHGCIRLGRDDLRKLWADVPVGTPIYIF